MLPVSAFSHAPKKITLSYDKESGSLIVSVIHPVKDVKDHYIESIAVKVNGEIVKTEEYTSQTSKESEDVTIALPDLKTGDEIEIRAKCNKMGAKTGEITLE
jgi:sulfur carrier protein ThiS